MAHKYKAKPFRDLKGRYWSSRGEFYRFNDLELMQMTGKISNLELQSVLNLNLNGINLCRFSIDFKYTEAGHTVYEDFKGMQTREFKLKKKLALALLGIDIRVTTSKDLSRGRK